MDGMEIKEKSTNHYNLAYDRPEQEETGFLNFLYNKKTGEVLGRNAMSWLKITVFYIIFYFFLGLFFLTCYKIFAAISLTPGRPRWTLSESLIGVNPGVGFRPMPDQDKNTDSSLIWINLRKEGVSSYWVDELNNFFDAQPHDTSLSDSCSFKNKKRASEDIVCEIDYAELAGCNRTNGYGYFSGTPCVLIKLNKIYNFVPTPYEVADLKLAAERGMPDNLQKQIRDYSKNPLSAPWLDSTWITCDGENPGDKESIGKLEFYAPGFKQTFNGIPNYFYPYLNQEGYQTPFLFVKFVNPRPNTLIQIECKAWAKNIMADRTLRLGSVHFELLVD